ncbi:MAG: HlyD family efflux transporter periplasmic adaptor subunit, partial [Eubacteriales bacterium]|nr:HlyD family efflux transporter periplasmic adaptor subunit [Eubacteriales bacterium]
YAPESGRVTGVFAKAGDSAADVIAQYGRLAALEKALPLRIEASTTGAYNKKENKLLHVGELLTYERVADNKDTGKARVIAVSGREYTLEVTEGDHELSEEVKLYRDDDRSSRKCVGRGRIVRADDLSVSGSGRVLRCCVSEGESVRADQLLFELAADAEPGITSAVVASPVSGALEVAVVSGQQVYKGQRLATVHDTSALQVKAQVDEVDLGTLKAGDAVELSFDRYEGERVQGTVASIAGLGAAKQNASYYDVRVTFQSARETLVGMSATLYLK